MKLVAFISGNTQLISQWMTSETWLEEKEKCSLTRSLAITCTETVGFRTAIVALVGRYNI